MLNFVKKHINVGLVITGEELDKRTTGHELKDKLNLSRRTLERWLKQLREEGKIEFRGGSKNRRLFYDIIAMGYYKHETAIVDEGCEIGKDTKIWHFSHIMPSCKMGERCNIGQNVVVSPDVVLGNNVKVQNNVSIYTGVTCGDDVFLGPSMVFTNVINPRSAINRRNQYAKTHVGKGASIGANATIVCGHDIGEYAFIGAGAVVTKNVPDFALVVGNPAKQIGWVGEYGHRLEFNAVGKAVCQESGQEYQLEDNKVKRIK